MTEEQIIYFEERSELTETAARYIAEEIPPCIERKGHCHLLLSGGSTPAPVYAWLAKPELADQVDWTRVHIGFGDERCVPPHHPESNYRMVREALLDHLPIPVGNVARIKGELDPHLAAEKLAEKVAYRKQDIVLLGLGEDGHVASLFPHTPVLGDPAPWAVVTESSASPTKRISVTLRVINAAHRVLFLVTGEHKAAILAKVFEERQSEPFHLPAAMVRPQTGSLFWFVDARAAGGLDLATAKPPMDRRGKKI